MGSSNSLKYGCFTAATKSFSYPESICRGQTWPPALKDEAGVSQTCQQEASPSSREKTFVCMDVYGKMTLWLPQTFKSLTILHEFIVS